MFYFLNKQLRYPSSQTPSSPSPRLLRPSDRGEDDCAQCAFGEFECDGLEACACCACSHEDCDCCEED